MTMTAPQVGSRAGPIDATQVTGRRVVATLIDGLVSGVAYWLLALAFGDIRTEGEAANWVANLPAVANIAYGLFVVGYYVLLEGLLGQTLGKLAVGIKVVAEVTGQPPGSPGRRSEPCCGSSTGCSATPWRSSLCWCRPSGNGWATWPPAP
jgi:RDD family